jgi:hypothetical protein
MLLFPFLLTGYLRLWQIAAKKVTEIASSVQSANHESEFLRLDIAVSEVFDLTLVQLSQIMQIVRRIEVRMR